MSEKVIRTIGGVPQGYEAVIIAERLKRAKQTALVVVASDLRAQQLAKQLKIIAPNISTVVFPSWDCLPYDRHPPSAARISQRLGVLSQLASNEKLDCVIIPIVAAKQFIAPPSHYIGHQLYFQKGDELSHDRLTKFLTERGYDRVDTVREPGEFAVRGGLIDMFPTGGKQPLRIDFFGDEIECIKTFDPITQLSGESIKSVKIKPAREVNLNNGTIQNFRRHYRESFGTLETELYVAISQARRYPGMEHYLPLFFSETVTIFDYVEQPAIFVCNDAISACHDHDEQIRNYYLSKQQSLKEFGLPPVNPQKLFLSTENLKDKLDDQNAIHLTRFSADGGQVENLGGKRGIDFDKSRAKGLNHLYDEVAGAVTTHIEHGNQVAIACSSDGSMQRLLTLLQDADDSTSWVEGVGWPRETAGSAVLFKYPMTAGFVIGNTWIISEQDILGERGFQKKPKSTKAEAFFTEASELNLGDLVVHREHGIGSYQGLQTIDVNGIAHDCMLIIYSGDDKLFLPVEHLDQISRYGSEGAAATLDKLGGAGWQRRKGRVKKHIREIADYLIKLAAERQLTESDVLEKDQVLYEKFCSGFPYPETDDQLKAISESLQDMASGKPMYRLICGDVGFGKTEVALRAAFVAAAAGKQVAVIVPTTLLCRQHYSDFVARMQGMALKVEQLSRFVKGKAAKQVRDGLSNGDIDIVVATHSILSDKTKFKNLGLIIVDEEQRFGVKQKERLKQLKAQVHVLTLTATPIPRTLQLSLTGVKDLSLITTPPIDRLAVQTYVMSEDLHVLKDAILREYNRGGQVFYVCPRIKDLQQIEDGLRAILPELRLVVAHGQLPATELENLVQDFYDHKYDILLSTNIVESGIDIPNANTLIIHRADLFGLAQLYQLRGRVGRGKAQAYAYLTLPEKGKVSADALKRLDVMQTLDQLGAGFSLASHDMDIRGAGNIVGEEQSGHIQEVGVELYQSLLQEAIIMARAKQDMPDAKDMDWAPQINLGMPVMIPSDYVTDLNLRLSLYRRLARLKGQEDMDNFASELVDRFGTMPNEVHNLIELVAIKQTCRTASIAKLDAGPKGAVITFRNNTFANPDKLMQFIQSQKGTVKVRPDQKIVFIRPWRTERERLSGVKDISRALSTL